MSSQLKAVVLAAGKGSRLISEEQDVPKVMRRVCGKPLLGYVLEALPVAEKSDIVIVVGYGKEQVTDFFEGYEFAVQTEQLGTGHAVMAASEKLEGFEGAVLVCYGDMPLVKQDTYEALVGAHFENGNDCSILTGQSDIPQPFGRILRDADGGFLRVVEERDCTPDELKITELNTGVYVFDSRMMCRALKKVESSNSQNEYYLTDVPEIMREDGAKIGLYNRELGNEILGVNTAEQLAQVEKLIE